MTSCVLLQTTAYVPAVQRAPAAAAASHPKGKAKGKRKAESEPESGGVFCPAAKLLRSNIQSSCGCNAAA